MVANHLTFGRSQANSARQTKSETKTQKKLIETETRIKNKTKENESEIKTKNNANAHNYAGRISQSLAGHVVRAGVINFLTYLSRSACQPVSPVRPVSSRHFRLSHNLLVSCALCALCLSLTALLSPPKGAVGRSRVAAIGTGNHQL